MDEKKVSVGVISLVCLFSGMLFCLHYQTLLEYLVQGLMMFGQWLREVSLQGGGYNIAAWALLLVITAIPLLVVLVKKKKHMQDLFSLALSLELFVFLYYLVNPTLLFSPKIQLDVLSYTEMWGFNGIFVILSTMICWLFFYVFNYIKHKPENKLEYIFILCAFIYAFVLGMNFSNDIFGALHTFTEGNSSQQLVNQTSNVNILVNVLFYIPKTFVIYILYLVSQFITKLVDHPFDDEILVYSSKLSNVCSKMIVTSLVLTFAGNMIQFLLFHTIAYATYSLEFPILTLFLCTTLILMHTYFKKVKDLHDDNESII